MTLSAANLKALVDTHQTETSSLEFKRDGYRSLDRGRTNLLDDIVSLANALGGHLVIGIAESAVGEAESFQSVADANAEANWIQNVAKTGIQPPIVGLDIAVARMSSGEDLVVVTVPKSLLRPHASVEGDAYRYRIRRGRTNGWLSPVEIKETVAAVASAKARVRNLLLEREQRYDMLANPRLLVQIAPISTEGEPIDIRDDRVNGLLANPGRLGLNAMLPDGFVPLGGTQLGRTLDGYWVKSGGAYLEFWGSGYVEYASTDARVFTRTRTFGLIEALRFTAAVTSTVEFAWKLYETFGIADEILLAVTIDGVADHRLYYRGSDDEDELPGRNPLADSRYSKETTVQCPAVPAQAAAFEALRPICWVLGADGVPGFSDSTREWILPTARR